jgi:hypothetical protein
MCSKSAVYDCAHTRLWTAGPVASRVTPKLLAARLNELAVMQATRVASGLFR